MTNPRSTSLIKAVPTVGRLLDQLNADYGGDLDDYLGSSWRDVIAERLFDAWADGYTTGFADDERFSSQ